jgi:hypothetical protein
MSRGKRRFPLTFPDAAGGYFKRLFSVQSFLFFPMGQPDDQATRHPFAASGHECHRAFWYPANEVFINKPRLIFAPRMGLQNGLVGGAPNHDKEPY